jgi:hypothetical protein
LSLKVRIVIFPVGVSERIIGQGIGGLEAGCWLVLAVFVARNLVPSGDDVKAFYGLVFISFLIFGFDVGIELMAKSGDGRLGPVNFRIAVHKAKQLLLRLFYFSL